MWACCEDPDEEGVAMLADGKPGALAVVVAVEADVKTTLLAG